MRGDGKVRVGDPAPDFTLRDQAGKPVQLRNLLGQGTVVLYFYPKDETPGCTLEARAFRDSYDRFTAAGAEVVGISSDSVASHRRFATRQRLPFLLLSDRDGTVRQAIWRREDARDSTRARHVCDRPGGGGAPHLFLAASRQAAQRGGAGGPAVAQPCSDLTNG